MRKVKHRLYIIVMSIMEILAGLVNPKFWIFISFHYYYEIFGPMLEYYLRKVPYVSITGLITSK